MDTESVAINLAVKEVAFLKKFLRNLLVGPCVEKLITILCDNTSTIAVTKDPKCHSKKLSTLKAITTMSGMCGKGEKSFVHNISSRANLADPLTKCLAISVFNNHFHKMELKSY